MFLRSRRTFSVRIPFLSLLKMGVFSFELQFHCFAFLWVTNLGEYFHVPGNCVLLWGAELGEHPSAALLQGAAWKGFSRFSRSDHPAFFNGEMLLLNMLRWPQMSLNYASETWSREQCSLRLPQSKLKVLIKSSKLQSCCLFWFPWSNTMTMHDHPWPSTIFHLQDRFPANYVCLGIDRQITSVKHLYMFILWFTCLFSEYFVGN